MKKRSVTRFIILIILFSVVITFNFAHINGQENKVSAPITQTDTDNTIRQISAADALNRTLPDISGYRTDRYVGLFYFTWMGQQGEKHKDVYDITKLLKSNKDALFSMEDNDTAPLNMNYFFNEPLFGYYNSADPYIIRKHLELFIAADIDFLALDFTNAIYYGEVLKVMLDIYLEYQNAGWDVPKLMFFTNSASGTIANQLYTNVYRTGRYDSLWFRGSGDKPMIIAWEDQLSKKMNEYFNVRPPQWPEAEFNADGWPYVEKVRPQRLYTNLMSVSVAQHTGDAFSFSVKGIDGNIKESWGRGYTSQKPENGNIDAIVRGDNFQEQWDYAIKNDPEMIFVTGWNEWTALKLTADWSDVPFWVDTFNTEFSRDIEMTKASAYVKDENGSFVQEGYGDNFYLQLIMNIRKYKGIPLTEDNMTEPVSKTIDINGDASDWDGVTNTYLNISTAKIERNHYGYIKDDRYLYTQAAPDNFIREIKVTHDDDNIYFRIMCDKDISERNGDALNWMNLLIGVKGNNMPSEANHCWETFNYVINRYSTSDAAHKTSMEKVSRNGEYVFERMDDILYSVNGSVMQIAVPRKQLGISNDKFTLCFKVTDSIEHPEDIMDYYVSGDSAPLGRLSYVYATEIYAEKQPGRPDKILSYTEIIILSAAAVMIIVCAIILAIKLIGNKNKKQN